MAEVITLEQIGHWDNLELLARQVVEGFIIGLHKSPYHGFSAEFSEHRPYNTGESTRNVDWKILARTDKVFVKKFEEETNLRAHIVLDASASMYYPDNSRAPYNKIKFSVVAAAALIHLLRRQRDVVALDIFSDTIRYASQAKSTTAHQRMLYAELEKVLNDKPQGQHSGIAACLHEVAEKAHQRSLIVIFSDMLDSMLGADGESSDIFNALQHLRHNKHEVILFYVHDKKHELEFTFDNRPHVFVDLETGEKVKLTPNDVKTTYVDKMQAFHKELIMRCGQYRIDVIEADINKGFDQVLMPYLVKRAKLY